MSWYPRLTAPEPDNKRALDVALAYGFDSAKVTASENAFFTPAGCGRGDHVIYSVSAVSTKGVPVAFTVCCGYPSAGSKGCGINF